MTWCSIIRSNDEPTPAEEQGSFDEHDGEGPTSYVAQFQSIKEMLVRSKRIQKKPRIQHVIDTVGTGIKAIEAVPAAIFSFLHKSNTCLKDVLFYSMSLGGDTDTIACMAGAIAGAYWGGKDIPKEWFPVTEGVEEITQYADELYELRVSQSTGWKNYKIVLSKILINENLDRKTWMIRNYALSRWLLGVEVETRNFSEWVFNDTTHTSRLYSNRNAVF